MKRSTKVILWVIIIAIVQFLLAAATLGVSLALEFMLIAYIMEAVQKAITFTAMVALLPSLLWWLYWRVKQDVFIPGNALQMALLGWLLGQCVISALIAYACLIRGQLVLVDRFLKEVKAPLWQVLLQLAASFLVGLAVFYLRNTTYKRKDNT